MSRLVFLEWVIIIAALFSLWPFITGYQSTLYRIYLAVVMLALVWVARNRLVRIRQAALEAKRKHDEILNQPSGRPPIIDP